jgi:hypothetical protein
MQQDTYTDPLCTLFAFSAGLYLLSVHSPIYTTQNRRHKVLHTNSQTPSSPPIVQRPSVHPTCLLPNADSGLAEIKAVNAMMVNIFRTNIVMKDSE